ncbi:UNVERIFIED_ORG: multiple sugar transport system substrate-binding protein [Ensifer adhaerens]|uniref:ABC transporter substrate-binding protein n=1 Tax=Ensifer canadensis TaxID=555315 RepID=UPI00148FB6FE|nr:sugar ABC transporter substrate-binding protein [Ensifer canadensis]MDP9629354.1 multiple sugar transport system substrate-binding protein [Ensifer adhaerens]NOV16822.1 sugar ABC transporter substrate-binding protein [Ensifer canadensis]
MINRRELLRNGLLLGGAAAFSQLPLRTAFADSATMRLYWWGTPARAERTLGVARLFEAANPDVKINGEVGGNDYWSKLTTMLVGGNAPDIFQLEPGRFADYARRNTTLPLNDFLGKSIRTDKLAPGVLELGTVDGKVAGMPLSLNAFALFYDTEAFKQAGLNPPGAATTWDEFAKLCVELTKAIDRKNVWAVGNASRYTYAFDAFLNQRGKRLYDEDGKIGFDVNDAKDWYGYWESLAKNGGCVSAEVQSMDQIQVDSNPLATGKAAMAIAFSNQLLGYQSAVKNPLGITTLPVTDPSGPSGLFYRPGLHFGIASTCENPELAARFIDFFVNDMAAGKVLGVERGVPVNTDVKGAVVPLIDDVSKRTVDYISSIAGRVGAYPPPVPVGASEFDTRAFRPLADKVAFGQVTPAEAADQLVAEGGRILKG